MQSFLRNIGLAALTLGLGPLFKLAGTAYLSFHQEQATPFAIIWALDAFSTFVLSFAFFSTDIYLTRTFRNYVNAEQNQLFWVVFIFVSTISFLLIIAIIIFGETIAVALLKLPRAQGCLLVLSMISMFSLNLFRIIFASLRILERKKELFFFSVLYYSIQFCGLIAFSQFVNDLVCAYYLSFVPTLLIIMVYSCRSFGFPNLRNYFVANLFSKYIGFIKNNYSVEPASSIFSLLERVIVSHFFNIDTINIYALAIKVVEPISMVGKVVKFLMIGTIVDFVRAPDVRCHGAKLVKMRRNLMFMLLTVFLSYPLISFLSDLWNLNFPPYSIILWISSSSVVGMLSFYYSTGFFARSDFSKTVLIDFTALAAAFCILMAFGQNAILLLAVAISTKVAVQFGLRVFYSSQLQGHLESSVADLVVIYAVLTTPILILVSMQNKAL